MMAVVVSNDGLSFFINANSRHFVFETLIVFNHGLSGASRANPDSGLAIFITTVVSNQRARPLTDPNPGSNIIVTFIPNNHRACVVMPDSRVPIFETNIRIDYSSGTVHGADASAHIAVTNIFRNKWMTAFAIITPHRDSSSANMMDDAISNRTGYTRDSDPRSAEQTDVLV